MTATIKELFGSSSVVIICESHGDMSDVALTAARELGVRNNSITIARVVDGSCDAWRESDYKWVCLKDVITSYREPFISMEGFDPDDKRFYSDFNENDYQFITVDEFLSVNQGTSKFSLSEQEFSEALRELL